MIRFKNKEDRIYSAFLVCLVDECKQEASKLWSTESNVVDVCLQHYQQLEAEKYLK